MQKASLEVMTRRRGVQKEPPMELHNKPVLKVHLRQFHKCSEVAVAADVVVLKLEEHANAHYHADVRIVDALNLHLVAEKDLLYADP